MQKLITLLLLCWLILPAASSAQLLKWRSDSLLTWDDFRAKKKPEGIKNRFVAMTHARWVHELYKDSLANTRLSVTTYFDCDKSWKRYRRPNPRVLRHEQTHFDISELYARKLRKAVAEYAATHDTKHDDTYPLAWIYRKKHSQMRRCQRRYDRQTNHSRRKKAQLRWDMEVARQLEELKDYAE